MRPALQVFAAILLLSVFQPSSASVRKLELADLARGATRIVHGTVTGMEAAWSGGRILTTVTLSVQTTVKGAAEPVVTFVVPGGTVGGITMHTGEAPSFRIGEEVVLFLRPGIVECDVYGWFQGKYGVSKGMIREIKDMSRDRFLDQVRALVAATGEGR